MRKPILLAVAVAALAPPLAAQTQGPPPAPEVTITALDRPRATDGAVIVITHHNRLTFFSPLSEFLHFDTPRGVVVLHLGVTPNDECTPACPDTLEVWQVPEGLIAVPAAIATPERGVGQIALIEWKGM